MATKVETPPAWQAKFGTGLKGTSDIMGLHHMAWRCRNSEETRRFYEDFLGLPLVDALKLEQTKTEDALNFLHTFYQCDDGSCLAFFEVANCEEIGRPFTFKEQSDFDLVRFDPSCCAEVCSFFSIHVIYCMFVRLAAYCFAGEVT